MPAIPCAWWPAPDAITPSSSSHACEAALFTHHSRPHSCARSRDARRLASMLAICRPSLIVTGSGEPPGLRPLTGPLATRTTSLDQLLAGTQPSESASDRRPGAGAGHGGGRDPDETAAIYFTSGSTGDARGVIVTRRMIGAVHGAGAAHWPLLARRRPVMVDWLPWHHVFGGLDNFFKMVWNGGACHVTAAPGAETIGDTVRLAAAVAPTLHVDVPLGLRLLLDRLESDDQSRDAFFERLELIFFAGAGLDPETWARLKQMTGRFADRARPAPRLASGYGCTEAGSTVCLAHEEPNRPDEIGVPLPGHALRLVDVDGRSEVRVRGPTVSPWICRPGGPTPDASRRRGLSAHGRRRRAGHPASTRARPSLRRPARRRLQALQRHMGQGRRIAPGAHQRMCAVHRRCGDCRGRTGLASCASLSRASRVCASGSGLSPSSARRALARHNAERRGSSSAIVRAMVMPEPPDPGAGELNDKGHLVQRRCLANRRDDVERLYAEHPDSPIVVARRT